MNIGRLSIQNPWWQGESLEYDPVLEESDSKKKFFNWKIFQESDWLRDNIYLVQGPRGIGKTTLFKNRIRDLLESEGFSPFRIFYYSCYNLSELGELEEAIKTFIKDSRRRKEKKRLYVFLDEATAIKDWQYGLSRLKKSGLFKNVTVVCSGSMAERSVRPEIKVKDIHPLSFRRFVSLSRPELEGRTPAGKILDYYLDAYFLTGGFPSAINDFYINNTVKQNIYDNFLYWLIADITFAGRDMFLAGQILKNILSTAGRPTGYKTLAEETKAKTHATIKDYIDIFERMFGIRIAYHIDDHRSLNSSKAKKIYFRDPLLFWLFYCYTNNSLHYWRLSRQRLHRYDIFQYLSEQVVFDHLAKMKGIKMVGYKRDIYRHEEIDFLAVTARGSIPVMVANPNKKSAESKEILKRAGFRQGIIVGDDKDAGGKIKTVPLTDLLWNLEEYFNI
jgi:hypothetical protein